MGFQSDVVPNVYTYIRNTVNNLSSIKIYLEIFILDFQVMENYVKAASIG